MQAEATPWHEMLTLPLNENTNQFLSTAPVFLNAIKKTGAVHQMISEIYLLLHLLQTGLPSGPITV